MRRADYKRNSCIIRDWLLLICSNQLLSVLFILTMKSVKPDNLIFDQSTRWLTGWLVTVWDTCREPRHTLARLEYFHLSLLNQSDGKIAIQTLDTEY